MQGESTSSLANLAPDLLDLILQFSGSFTAIEFWKTGNKQMRSRLSGGGCTSVDLRDTSAASTSRWPHMLIELCHLRTLKIFLERRLDKPETVGKSICYLSPLLHELILDFPEADIVLSAVKVSHGLIETLSYWQYKRESSLEAGPLIYNLGHLFPELKRLTLRESKTHVDLSQLPLSLETLEVFSEVKDADAPQRARFRVSELPKKLTTLKITRPDLVWTTADLVALPPHLTSFNADFSTGPPSYIMTINAEVQSLPQTITRLGRIRHLPKRGDFARFLPPLEAWADVSSGLDDKYLEQLPHSITDLTLLIGDMYYRGPTLTAALLKLLPHKLRRLVVQDVNWLGMTSSDFPPFLEQLVVDQGARGTLWNPPQEVGDPTFDQSPTTVERALFASPPGYLQHLLLLDIPALAFHPEVTTYPVTLTKMNIGRIDCADLAVFLRAIPNVTDLRFGTAFQFDDLAQKALPPRLQSLQVYAPVNNDFPRALPPTLTHLELDIGCTYISESDIGSLPRSLTYFQMGSGKRHEGYFAARLPPSLRTLKATRLCFKEGDIINLPRTLRHLQCTMENITPTVLAALPRKLQSFEPAVSARPSLNAQSVDLVPTTLKTMVIANLTTDRWQVRVPDFSDLWQTHVAFSLSNMKTPDPRLSFPTL